MIPTDPGFKEGDRVKFGILRSDEKVYTGQIRGIAWKNVITGYIVYVNDKHLKYCPNLGRLVFSDEYQYSSVVVPHNFIERI